MTLATPKRILRGPVLTVALLGAACARPAATAVDSPSGVAKGRAYDVVMQATSCWMGGLWSDALGERGTERIEGIVGRCHDLMRSVVAPGDDYYPLRAVEPRVVDAIAQRVSSIAGQDPAEASHADQLVALLRATADAMRETIDARRAADVVKEDVGDQPQVDLRNVDKVAAAPKLEAGHALDALLHLDAGPFAGEAHAIGVLSALDRMEIARGLPKHLKMEAVRTAFADVFGVSPPPLPDDASKPIRSGTWLGYLTEVSAAAGHPVPTDAHDPQNREPLAWTGVLEGFADKMRVDTTHFPAGTPIGDIVRPVLARLEDEYRGERVVYEAHAPQFR